MTFKSLRLLVAINILTLTQGNTSSNKTHERSLCQTGYYCPLETSTPVPCPKGTYGPHSGAVSIVDCLVCPPQHYCPRAALAVPLPCGPSAHHPLSGQDTCLCPGEGQHFQASDAQCHCTLGYQPSNNIEVCSLKLYEVCRDGKTRTQYGDCLDRHQWAVHCRYQVCQSAEEYRGYDSELALCLCKEPGGRTSSGGLDRRRATDELKLQCQSNGELELVWRHRTQVSSISGLVLETQFLLWDSLGTLQCTQQRNTSRPVYIVQTTGDGFFGLISGLPGELHSLFPSSTQQDTERYPESDLWEGSQTGNISLIEVNFSRSGKNWSQFKHKEIDTRPTGVLSPTACLHLGDILLFKVSTNHYPEYDLDNLYNTNAVFDWGAFRQLKEELALSWTPPSFFSVAFNQPGVYVFKLSSNEHRHMYVRVMPADGQCYEPGPFFSTIPRNLNRVGINRRRKLLLQPDWFVTGGLVFGAVIILCLCVTLLILFREYGWPEKKPVKVKYHMLHLAYNMDDYSSKGSRVISVKKTHRNQHTRMTLDSTPPEPDTLEEFWDYEHQVDLEAFSSNTFYTLLLKQSLSVTTRLGQLTTEVKELYQGVTGKLQLLQPCLITENRTGDSYEKIKREVDREVGRRKSLGTQLKTLLVNQLQSLQEVAQDMTEEWDALPIDNINKLVDSMPRSPEALSRVLKREQQAQGRTHTVFTAHLRECTRLLSKISGNHQTICEQNVIPRLTFLVDGMGDLLSAQCQRQGAWGFLGEGTGAKLLCPETGTVLTKDHLFGVDGSVRVSQALHYDSVTGLIRPNAHCHLLLSSGHTMAVPPNFFVHPQTGRVMPIAGNVAYDPASSTLVFTVDSCTGDSIKWDSPLLPFVPYPTYYHSGQPLSKIRFRGLRPGQRLQLGVPMADPDTGVPVPILGVTIHPVTGLVYPLGGLHMCPLTRQRQPIQIGSPMLESRTGNLVLTVGISLDSVTGAVLPVGGVLLSDLFMDPLSGRMLRVGGASIRAGQLIPHGGGYQTLLDSKVLAEMFKVLDLLKQMTDECAPYPAPRHTQAFEAVEGGSSLLESLPAAANELHQAWGRSLPCQLQLQIRLEMLLGWAMGLEQDGGACGEMPLTGSNVCVPALLGMEYPDPGGSGLSVPVLGYQTEPLSGTTLPLAGTMEDIDGKGLEAIRYGCQVVDPVTGILAPVVGARLDMSRKTVVPLTASYWLTMTEQTDSMQIEVLQREVCARNTYWQQQRLKEEDILSDLDSSLSQCVYRITDIQSYQVQWSVRPLKEAALEMQETAQIEAQRRAAQSNHLALVLPPHAVHILTLGDEEEWHRQCAWQSELGSGFEKLEVCIEQLQQDQERHTIQQEQRMTSHLCLDKELRLREAWEQCYTTQAQLDDAVNALHVARLQSQLCADTAQAVLTGHFWYKDYGLVQCSGHRVPVNVRGLLREKALPLLMRLNQLLEDKQHAGLSLHPCNQEISDLQTKQAHGTEVSSRVWTESVAVVQANSTQSLREPAKTQSQDTGLEMSSAPTHTSQRHSVSSGLQSQESQALKEEAPPHIISIPLISEEEWNKLLQQSPLFHMLKRMELQMKTWASGTGLVRGDHDEKGKTFVDVLDAQWECEGELIPMCPSTLNSREYLVYQHGLFLMQTLHNLQLTPVVTLQIATSLPCNNYINNAFRNSFFYQEAEETLFVRRQRLQSVGGFSLLLLHSLSHIKMKDMSYDSSPAFQRLFFKVLQASLGELFQTRLRMLPSGLDKEALSGDINETQWESGTASLLHRLHSPSRGLLSQDEIQSLHWKHSETSMFTRLEQLLSDQKQHTTE